MQQGQAEAGANKIVKWMLIVLSLIFILSNVYAQNDNSGFQRSFIKQFRYPQALKNSCIPTFANILIDVSAKGIITNISISDSAPRSFTDQFEKIKSLLDKAPLDSIIREKKLKSCCIVIAVFYIYQTDWCVNSFEEFIPDKYLLVNGKEIEGLTYNLKPIIVNMYKPMH
ncbi:MAG: hypothetical protein JWP45_2690 [Mucilaginibacter sp.]|nr:hypothetical protein [Mucilaginibacter sp.]